MSNKIELAEFVPPTEDEERERMAEVAAVREVQKQPSAAADRATNPEEDFMRGLTDDQRERMPRLQARAKVLADAGDLDGVARIKRMFDSEYTKTAERADGTLWDYTQVTPWTLDDAVAQITEPTEDGKTPTLAEQMRRFKYCSERRLNKDGMPYGPPKMTDNNLMVWCSSRPWAANLAYSTYNGGNLIWRSEGMNICLPEWRRGKSAEQPKASFEGEGALRNRDVTEFDITTITSDIRRAFGVEFHQWNEKKTEVLLRQMVSGDPINPFLDYLKGLKWDGKIRIPEMISNLEHTDYTRAWCEKFLYSIIHRQIQPGSKVDYVFTLVGESNTRKTSFLKSVTMGILPTPVFTQLPTENKDQLMKAQAGAVVIMDEVDTLVDKGKYRGASAGELKAYISDTTDNYRDLWVGKPVERAKQYVNVATSNRKDFISDLDGHRRWAVLEITKQIPDELTPNGDRSYWDMLLAEAYYRYTEEGYQGPSDKEFVLLSEASRLEHLDDPVYDSIVDWLERPASERTLGSNSSVTQVGVTTPTTVKTHSSLVNIDCLDIRLLRDAIPDLERRKITGSFKQQVTGAMDRMYGFVRVELEKNDKGVYKKKRRVVNGKNKPIHIAWDLLATLQAYDAADNPLGEPVECLASDVPANAAGAEPYGAYPTRVDANDNLVADRKFDAGFFQKGLLPAGAAYVRVDYPYDVPITSASTLSVSN